MGIAVLFTSGRYYFGSGSQARSQKFAMGGLGAKPPAAGDWGFGGKAPSGRRHGGLEASPQRSKILHFFAKITSF